MDTTLTDTSPTIHACYPPFLTPVEPEMAWTVESLAWNTTVLSTTAVDAGLQQVPLDGITLHGTTLDSSAQLCPDSASATPPPPSLSSTSTSSPTPPSDSPSATLPPSVSPSPVWPSPNSDTKVVRSLHNIDPTSFDQTKDITRTSEYDFLATGTTLCDPQRGVLLLEINMLDQPTLSSCLSDTTHLRNASGQVVKTDVTTGNSFVAGHIDSPIAQANTKKSFVVMMKPDKSLQWHKQFGIANEDTHVYSMILVFGEPFVTGVVTDGSGTSSVFVAKFGFGGNFPKIIRLTTEFGQIAGKTILWYEGDVIIAGDLTKSDGTIQPFFFSLRCQSDRSKVV